MMSEAKVGRSLPRVEDEPLLRGAGAYLDDLPTAAGTLHAAFVRSPVPHGTLSGIDASEALALPGVVAVLTAADLPLRPLVADSERLGFQVTARDPLCTDRVRFVGDAVALVLADDPYVALDAAELVLADIDPDPSLSSALDALEPDAPRLYGGGNVLYEGHFTSDDFDAALAAAPHRLTERFRAARMAAVSLEPRGVLANVEADGILTLVSSTQIPNIVRTTVAEELGLDPEAVRVKVPDIGGGFGVKAVVYPEEIVLAAAARHLGRPVKWVQDRYDDFLTSAHARDHVYDLTVGYDDTGRVLAIDADVLVNIGAYPTLPFGASFEANGAPRNMPGPYRLENFRYRCRAVVTNTCPTGAYRGVSAPIACFAVEGMLDRIARRLGLDPAEVRQRNLITEFPYRNVLGITLREGTFAASMERALAMMDVATLRAAPAPEGKRRGIGIAVVTEQTGMGSVRYQQRGLLRVPGFETACARLTAEGVIVAATSQAAIGQGSATAFTQILCEALGVAPEAVRILRTDTGETGRGTGTFASRGMVLAGRAVAVAGERLAERIAEHAADKLECAPGDIVLAGGRAHVAGAPPLGLDFAEIGAATGGLDAEGEHDTTSTEVASATHVASVLVDIATGEVAVERYVVVHDCGRVINPVLVDGQIHGAVVQGLGEALREAIHYDPEGQPLSISLMDYQIPRSLDVPGFQVEAMHSEAGASIVKGAGEIGTIGAIPALANAIGDALAPFGAAVTALPQSAAVVRAALAEAAQ